jgi:hypothetical protein
LAAEEYVEASRHYLGIDPALGKGFVKCVEAGIDAILRNPAAWSPVDEDVRRVLLPRFPFGIHYTLEEDFVLIVSVSHLKRKPGYWKNRLG